MKVFKKFAVKLIHACGYDIYKLQQQVDNPFLGLRMLPIRTIIDIGANRGQFAKQIIEFFPQASFYCFEPLPESFRELEIWSSRFYPRRFTLFNAALGDASGTATLYSPIEHNDASSLLESTEVMESLYPIVRRQRRVSVHVTTLDAALGNQADALLPEILIKIDVEGYEDRVIRGGVNIFKMAKACVLEICLDELHRSQATFSGISTLMEQLGYGYAGNIDQVCAADGHVIYINAAYVRK